MSKRDPEALTRFFGGEKNLLSLFSLSYCSLLYSVRGSRPAAIQGASYFLPRR